MSQRAIDTHGTCPEVKGMATTIELRNVPEELRRRLEKRAAKAGLSLSDYLFREILEMAERPMPEDRPTLEELQARLATRSRVEPNESPADVIRELRGPLP